MSNTLLTSSIIAREALIVLEANLVAAGLVYRDYSDEFAKVGDTITIRKPATFTAQTFTSTISAQNATESGVSVVLDRHLDVSFAVTSKELALSIQDFSAQFIQPAMRAHAQAIDASICALYKDIPHYSRSSDTTAWTSLKALTAGRKVLNDNLVPMNDRRALLNTASEAALLGLDAVIGAEKSGSTDALRQANVGRLMGLDVYMDQNVPAAHTSGTVTTAGNFSATAGSTTFTVAAGSPVGGTFKKGDIVTITGDALPYVVTADATLSGGAGTVYMAPAARVTFSSAAGTARSQTTGGNATPIAFHKNAFALVTRPLARPLGSANAETISYNGISVRVVYGYDMSTKTDTVSLDLLYGVKTLDERLGVRLEG